LTKYHNANLRQYCSCIRINTAVLETFISSLLLNYGYTLRESKRLIDCLCDCNTWYCVCHGIFSI